MSRTYLVGNKCTNEYFTIGTYTDEYCITMFTLNSSRTFEYILLFFQTYNRCINNLNNKQFAMKETIPYSISVCVSVKSICFIYKKLYTYTM